MDIDEEKYKEELYSKFPDFKKIKPNPNNWPIIDKYNRRIFKKNKFTFFDWIQLEIKYMTLQSKTFCDSWCEDSLRDFIKAVRKKKS